MGRCGEKSARKINVEEEVMGVDGKDEVGWKNACLIMHEIAKLMSVRRGGISLAMFNGYRRYTTEPRWKYT